MKKLLLSAALVAGGSLGLHDVSFAHGGQYRGPGDTVPPGGGGGGGGGGPSSPGPSGPSAPGGSGPSTPGPAGPGSPGGAGGGAAGPVTGGGDSGPDLTAWSFWWEFNKEPYLNLKAHIHSGGVVTGSEGWFLGHGQKTQSKDSLRPTEEQVRQKVVPALLAALENETNNDIITGALIALAKIGDAKSESGESEFEKVIAKKLADKVQEISETAAVALGILANDNSVKTLAALLKDEPQGRQLVGSPEVSYRTRSFAAYGLGLIGARTGSEEVRRTVVRHLADVLETDQSSARDLSVACLISIGLVPLDTVEQTEPAPAAGEKGGDKKARIDPSLSRVAQIDYVLEYFLNEENRFLVRAHAPTALGRLLRELPPEVHETYKEKVSQVLLERLDKRSKEPREVVQSSVLALALIGDNDADKTDAEIRKALSSVPADVSDIQARNYAMIAMAKVGGTLDEPASAEDGIKEASKFLLEQLSRGKTQVKPWAGLGIGVMGRKLTEATYTTPQHTAMTQALRSALKEEGNDDWVGAYAIAIGILGDAEATELLLEKFTRMKNDTARGYIAVALGLVDARGAIETIQNTVKESKYRPELLKQAAIALGVLGDKQLVPDLIDMLREAKALGTQAAISSALGFIGDQRSIDPLVEMLANKDLTERARGFAAVALGIVADKELLPWNSKIAEDLNYRASTNTLTDQNGTGILDIL